MIVKSFVLRRESFPEIVRLCGEGTIAVVRPEKKFQTLFKELIHSTIVLKKKADTSALKEYLDALPTAPGFAPRKEEFLEYVLDYLRLAKTVHVSLADVEAYILSECACLCAEAVAVGCKGEVVDGRELVVCRQDGAAHVFDWAASRGEISRILEGRDGVVVAGGYARLEEGTVVGVGKGGANLMASLIASALNASHIEFYVEGDGIEGISEMTYDEAAHYCASKKAPFTSASLWPAKNAGIPIIVHSISNPSFGGTRISSQSAAGHLVSGCITDAGLDLVTVYGTGLLGNVGVSSSIFSSLARAGVNIRFISQTSSEYSISFAVASQDSAKVSEVLGKLASDNPLLSLDDVMIVNNKVGIITIFGSRMKNIPGISGKVFSLLGDAGINVIASAQGGEELSISIVIDAADIEKAAALMEDLK